MTTKEIIEQIAREHHTTPEVVEKEMQSAICAGMACSDPRAQALWKQIAPDGKVPSIEIFLKFCVDRMDNLRNGESR